MKKLVFMALLALLAADCGTGAFAASDRVESLAETLKSEKRTLAVLEGASGHPLEEMVEFCHRALFQKKRIGSGQPGTHCVWVFPQSTTLVSAAIGRLRREKSKPDRDLLAEYVAMAVTHHSGDQQLALAIHNARSAEDSSRTNFALGLATLRLTEPYSETWRHQWVRIMTEPIPVSTNLTDSSLYERLSVHDGKTAENIWTALADRWKRSGEKGKKAREAFIWRIHVLSMQHPEAHVLDPFIRRAPELLALCMKSYSHTTRREFRHTVLNAITDSFSTYKDIIGPEEREAFVRKVIALEDDPRLRQEWQDLLKKIEQLNKAEKDKAKGVKRD